MKNQIWILLQLLLVAVVVSAQTQTQSFGSSSCPLYDEWNHLDAIESDELNQALQSAADNFNQNPTYSAANAAFASAIESLPSSVTLSLYCSGYGGINLNSLPAWLSAVPTSYVSDILQEQSAYSSIISSFVAGAATATSTGSLTAASSVATSIPSSTVATPSSPTPESTSAITSPTSAQQPSPSHSSGGISGIPAVSLTTILILAASVVLALL